MLVLQKINHPIWNIFSVSTLHVQVYKCSRYILIFITTKKKKDVILSARATLYFSPTANKYINFFQLWNFQQWETIYTLIWRKRKTIEVIILNTLISWILLELQLRNCQINLQDKYSRLKVPNKWSIWRGREKKSNCMNAKIYHVNQFLLH